MYCKADLYLHIRWNSNHLSMFVENKYLVQFGYTAFLASSKPFITDPGYWKFCVEYILTGIAWPLEHDEVKIDLMLVNMKNNIFPLISAIILPKVLTPCYPLHIETLTVIYSNSCVGLNVKEKAIDISQLYQIVVVMS